MPSFEPADHATASIVYELAREPHRAMSRVKIATLIASTEGEPLPEITVKASSPLHRAAGCADLLVIISEVAWGRRTDAGRRALVDHGLTSVRVVEEAGCLALDTAGRPRLRRQPKDCPVGYRDVWARWRSESLEARVLAEAAALDPTRESHG